MRGRSRPSELLSTLPDRRIEFWIKFQRFGRRKEMSRRPSLLVSCVSPGICTMTVWCRKVKRSYPLGVQQRFFVLFSLPKLVRALLNQRALHPSHRHCPGVPPEEMRTFDCASCFGTKCTNSTQQVSARSYSSATRILHLRILFCRGVGRKSWFSVWPAKLLPRILRWR